jgi:putative transport protein
MLLAIALLQRLWKVDYAREAHEMRQLHVVHDPLHSRTIHITQATATGRFIHELVTEHKWDVLFGRVKRGEQLTLAHGRTRLALGDLVTVVGAEDALEAVTRVLGEISAERLEMDRRQLDYRRVFVSSHKIAGHRLRDLNLPQQFGAVVTRVRRGDVEFLPHGDLVLELGDRVRVLAHRDQLESISKFFGDSYKALSEIDILTFSLGLALGLLLGLAPLPIAGVTLKLGLAGGPLVVALLLGALVRTGPFVWHLPYSANLTIRQIGLVLFLAGVGTRAGYAFLSTFLQGGGLAIFLSGALITTLTATATLWIGYKWLKIPMGLLMGMLAGLQTQPAVLGFALEQSGNDLPNIGYATVYPLATIAKILIVQVLVVVLW